MNDFSGLVAVVTGGSSGIGAATAVELRTRGAQVAVIDRAASSDPDVHAEIADITSNADVSEAVKRIVDRFGSVDVLINNAGIGAVGDVSANNDDEWHRVFDINVVGAVRVSRALLPQLRESAQAAIVNTASVAGLHGLKDRVAYSASKGALIAMTYAMAADHLADGIRVNAIAPGTADTPWVQRLVAAADDSETAAEQLRQRQPLGRLVSPDELAFAIANLASPRSGSTTGTVVTVDGGLTTLRI